MYKEANIYYTRTHIQDAYTYTSYVFIAKRKRSNWNKRFALFNLCECFVCFCACMCSVYRHIYV